MKNERRYLRSDRPRLSKRDQTQTQRIEKWRLRIGTLNVGTMTSRSREFVREPKKRKVDIAAVQETRWNGGKSKDLREDYKLIYYGDSGRNGVGVIVSETLRECVAEVHRWPERLMAVTLDIDSLRLTIISAYAPQTGCSESEKDEFWENLRSKYDNHPELGIVLICGDLNGHVGQSSDDFECHGGHGYGTRSEDGERIVDFAE